MCQYHSFNYWHFLIYLTASRASPPYLSFCAQSFSGCSDLFVFHTNFRIILLSSVNRKCWYLLGTGIFSSPESRQLSLTLLSLFLVTSASSPLTWSFSLFCPSQPAYFAPISSSSHWFCTYLQTSTLCQSCLGPVASYLHVKACLSPG